MGYSREIKAWVCEQNRQQADGMLEAWGQAWLNGAEEVQEGASYWPHIPHLPPGRASEITDGGSVGLDV